MKIPQKDDSWFKVGAKGKYVKENKEAEHKKEQITIFGSKPIAENEEDNFAVKTCRTWHFKISQLKPSITSEQVQGYMDKHDVKAMDVEKCNTKSGAPGTMHIEVPYEYKEAVMNAEFWPCGVKVGGWRFPRLRRKRNDWGNDWSNERDWHSPNDDDEDS